MFLRSRRVPLGAHAQAAMGPAQVGTAQKKLAGAHPVEVLIKELAPRHAGTKYWASLQVRRAGAVHGAVESL